MQRHEHEIWRVAKLIKLQLSHKIFFPEISLKKKTKYNTTTLACIWAAWLKSCLNYLLLPIVPKLLLDCDYSYLNQR